MTRIVRRANIEWRGNVPEGRGHIALGSGAFAGPYSLRSREGDTRHTNPEELLGAANAACFSMALTDLLDQNGTSPTLIQTRAKVTMEEKDGHHTITSIALRAVGDVDDIDEATFVQLAERAKASCPISRALSATPITLEAELKTARVTQ